MLAILCALCARPDLAFGNAMWDQQRLAFLSHLGRLGHGAPELLLALSSASWATNPVGGFNMTHSRSDWQLGLHARQGMRSSCKTTYV